MLVVFQPETFHVGGDVWWAGLTDSKWKSTFGFLGGLLLSLVIKATLVKRQIKIQLT